MQLITAIIQPFMLDRLTRVLRKQNISGYTVTQVEGSGRDLADTPEYLQPRVKIEIAVNDENVPSICDLIGKTVSTHQEGDGILYVMPLLHVVNIQTGLKGPAALTVD